MCLLVEVLTPPADLDGPSLSPHPPSSDFRHHGPWMLVAAHGRPSSSRPGQDPRCRRNQTCSSAFRANPSPEWSPIAAMSLEQSAPSLLQRWKYFSTHAVALSIPLVLPFPPSLVPPPRLYRIGWLGKWECNPSPNGPRSSQEAPLSHFTLHYPTLPYLPLHCTSIFLFLTHLNCLTSLHFNSFEPCPALSYRLQGYRRDQITAGGIPMYLLSGSSSPASIRNGNIPLLQ